MHINWKKEIFPHIYAILAFLILAFAYCSPVLKGAQVRQGDMLQYEGMAHEAKTFYQQTGKPPLWSNSMFGGMPTFMTYTGPPANKASIINSLTTLWMPRPVNMLFIAMLGVYFLLSVLGFKYWVNLFGGVAYGFSSYNLIIIGVGHITKMYTMAWMAPVLAGILLIYNRKYLIGAVVTALSAMMLVYNNHYQIIYYTAILLAFLVIWRFILALKEKQIRSFVIASLISLGVGILAVIPSLPHILVTREYSKYSIRDSQSKLTLKDHTNNKIEKGGLNRDYAFQWSLGKLESFSVFIPNIYGGPPPSDHFLTDSHTYKQLTQLGVPPQQAAGIANRTFYWGPQPFTSPVYFGALICFLFILSLFIIRNRNKWWLLAITLISFLMAWGNHFPAFNNFLFRYLPLYNKFRAPSMTLVIPQLTFVVMACWALNDILTGKCDKKAGWEALKKAFYLSIGLIIFAWLIVGGGLGYSGVNDGNLTQMLGRQGMDQLRQSIHKDRAALFQKDALRTFIFVALTFILLWAFIKEKIKPVYLFVFMSILLLFDLFPVDKRYLNDDNFVPAEQLANHYQPSEAERHILQDKAPDVRTLNLSVGFSNIFNDAATSYFLKSIGGYSPAKLWRYQDLIDHQLMPNLQTIYGAFQSKKGLDSSIVHLLSSFPVLNMLNTRYFIVDPNSAPLLNPGALGNAWFVDHIRWEPDANKEMLALSDFDPASTAIIPSSFKDNVKYSSPVKDSSAHIELTRYGLNQMQYQATNDHDGFGVFSEIYYPDGWKAYVDDKEVPIVPVNYVLRGIDIPAGNHKIVFKFHPQIFYTGKTLSSVSSGILILLILIGFGFDFYRKHRRVGR